MEHRRIALLVAGVLPTVSSVAFAQSDDADASEASRNPPAAQAGGDIEVDDLHEAQKKTEEPGAKAPAREEMEPSSEPPKKEDDDDQDAKKFTLSGYVESFYQWNFNRPGNGITNYRGYDSRHNSITLSNAVLDAGFRSTNLLGRLALQVGHTASASYSQETRAPGTDGAGESDDKLWRFLQRASVGWQATKIWLFEAGLFLSNLGVESLAVKDNWNWSRTNAFARFPSYQTGVKATAHTSDRLDISGGVFNGWNNIVDNNDEKSVLLQAQYKVAERLSTSVAYLGGIERPGGAPEGRAWRHLFDIYFQLEATEWMQLAAEGNGGWEQTRFGAHWFAGAAAYARAKATKWFYVSVRGDRLWEDPAANDRGMSQPVLIPVRHVTSLTATLDARPVKGLSMRIEGRHDRADETLYFEKETTGDGSPERPYLANARTQNTILGGAVVWF